MRAGFARRARVSPLDIGFVRGQAHKHHFLIPSRPLVDREGLHSFIVRVQVRLLPSETKNWASMDNFGYSCIHAPDDFHRRFFWRAASEQLSIRISTE